MKQFNKTAYTSSKCDESSKTGYISSRYDGSPEKAYVSDSKRQVGKNAITYEEWKKLKGK
jgi:hypothetical protein